MSSWGLKASILLALDAYDGTWLPLTWLARRVMANADQVEAACHELADHALLQRGSVDGTPCFGVHVDAFSPLCTQEPRP
jgi:hypothetical protein